MPSTTRLILSAALLPFLLMPARAGSVSNLASNGSDGSITADITATQNRFGSPSVIFDTDNGTFYDSGYFGGGYGVVTVTPTVISQTGGPNVNAYNFTDFTLAAGKTLTLVGSTPAAILTTGSVSIAGTLTIGNAGGAAGSGGFGATAATSGLGLGGGPGQGVGSYWEDLAIPPWPVPTVFYTAGNGGGGGMASKGGAGESGVPQYGPPGNPYTNPPTPNGPIDSLAGGAGGPAGTLSILQGGGGGGGGGGANVPGGATGGSSGGVGGGALMLETPDNLTITSTGQILANGSNGLCCNYGTNDGAGGGGGGGYIWFETAGIWDNEGLVEAEGGAGGVDCCDTYFSTVTGSYWGPDAYGGAGSGGYVNIDVPTEIINNGTIDVADGSGGTTNGGLVNLNDVNLTGDGQILGDIAPEPGTSSLVLAGLGCALAVWKRKRG